VVFGFHKYICFYIKRIIILKIEIMKDKPINIVYIDGTNLYKGIESLGIELDYIRFRKWLLHKYRITKAYIFMGYISKQAPLYKYLESASFSLIFKESITQKGIVKGNADSEMVLKSVRDVFEETPDNVILVSGDGDFSCLVDFLIEKEVFKTILIPNKNYVSYLLRKKNISMTFLEDKWILSKIQKSERTPRRH